MLMNERIIKFIMSYAFFKTGVVKERHTVEYPGYEEHGIYQPWGATEPLLCGITVWNLGVSPEAEIYVSLQWGAQHAAQHAHSPAPFWSSTGRKLDFFCIKKGLKLQSSGQSVSALKSIVYSLG